MQANISDESLIKTIQKRELSINNIKTEMIKHWISQGEDLLQLQVQQQCSQNKLTNLTGVSKGSVYNYIHIAKDKRVLEWLQSDHHGGQLENFNQKELLQLTKLNDSSFETSINSGVIVSTPKDQVIDAEIIENSINEKIHKKEEYMNKLVMDVIALKKELSSKTKWDPKPVAQIDDKGKIMAKYPSAQSAQRVTGIDKSSIGHVCRGSIKKAGGYQWIFTLL